LAFRPAKFFHPGGKGGGGVGGGWGGGGKLGGEGTGGPPGNRITKRGPFFPALKHGRGGGNGRRVAGFAKNPRERPGGRGGRGCRGGEKKKKAGLVGGKVGGGGDSVFFSSSNQKGRGKWGGPGARRKIFFGNTGESAQGSGGDAPWGSWGDPTPGKPAAQQWGVGGQGWLPGR